MYNEVSHGSHRLVVVGNAKNHHAKYYVQSKQVIAFISLIHRQMDRITIALVQELLYT